MGLMTKLLTGYVSPHDLYVALIKSKYLSRFRLEKYTPFITGLDIDIENESIHIVDLERLYSFAMYFDNGTQSISKNKKNYLTILALIFNYLTSPLVNPINQSSQNNDWHEIIKCLNRIKATLSADKKIMLSSTKKKIEIVSSKLDFYQKLMQSGVGSYQHLKKITPYIVNSIHAHREVKYCGKVYIEKVDMNPHVAGIEVFCGTMMEFYIGPHQPSTIQLRTEGTSDVSVLSEKLVNFQRFNEGSAFKRWQQKFFKNAAILDFASLFMAETDYHCGNGGLVKINGEELPVRIDFDRMLAPITLGLIDVGKEVKMISYVGGNWKEIKELTNIDGFELNPLDINQLPFLSDPFIQKDVKNHYIPNNWWISQQDNKGESYLKYFTDNAEYLADLHQSILEKIITPVSLVKLIAEGTIFNLSGREQVLDLMQRRQAKLIEISPQIRGFSTYLSSNRAILDCQAIKTKYYHFINKRADLISSNNFSIISERIGKSFDDNFKEYVHSMKIEPITIKPDELNLTKIFFERLHELIIQRIDFWITQTSFSLYFWGGTPTPHPVTNESIRIPFGIAKMVNIFCNLKKDTKSLTDIETIHALTSLCRTAFEKTASNQIGRQETTAKLYQLLGSLLININGELIIYRIDRSMITEIEKLLEICQAPTTLLTSTHPKLLSLNRN